MPKTAKENAYKRLVEKINEWAQADKDYKELIDKYVPMREVVPGKMRLPQSITSEVLVELDSARRKLETGQKAMAEAIRQYVEQYGG